MNKIKEHIILRFVTITLVAALMTPLVVKLSHIYKDHVHEVCTSVQAEHLHEIDLDCEFYKFKVSNEFTYTIRSRTPVILTKEIKPVISQYNFISDFEKLSFALRGPPVLV
jgi:hypothetical protein